MVPYLRPIFFSGLKPFITRFLGFLYTAEMAVVFIMMATTYLESCSFNVVCLDFYRLGYFDYNDPVFNPGRICKTNGGAGWFFVFWVFLIISYLFTKTKPIKYFETVIEFIVRVSADLSHIDISFHAN